MVVDVVKTNLTLHAETSTDEPHWPDYMLDFAQAVKLIQAAVLAGDLIRVHARFQGPPGEFRSEYFFNGGPTFELRRNTSVVPNTVRVMGNGAFTDEERATVQRIHEEIENLRLRFALTIFDWQQS